jgi:hypothetical protein
MSKAKPYRAADYLGDKADVTALVKYAAHLEASNTELLEALEALYATFQLSNDFRLDSKVARQARAAIARAKGEQPCPHGHLDWDDCPDCRH